MTRTNVVGSLLTVTLVIVLVALAVPDPSLAGPLKDIGKNTGTEVGGLIGSLFLVALGITFLMLWFKREYPQMVLTFVVGSVVAYMVFSPAAASDMMKSVANSIFP